jgi:hypothetical protein
VHDVIDAATLWLLLKSSAAEIADEKLSIFNVFLSRLKLHNQTTSVITKQLLGYGLSDYWSPLVKSFNCAKYGGIMNFYRDFI